MRRTSIGVAVVAGLALLTTGTLDPPAKAAAPAATTPAGLGALIYIANDSTGRIDVHDAVTGKPVPRLGVLDTTFDDDAHNQIEVGDLNGDHRDEILVANDSNGRVDVLDAVSSRPVPGLGVRDTTFDDDDHNQLEVGDVTGDERDEVLIANAASGRIDVLDGATGSPVPGYGIPDTTFDNDDHNQIGVGDVNGDGRDEVLIANDTGGRIDVFDADTGAPVAGLGIGDTTFNDSDHNQMAVADVDGDGRDEVLIANDAGGRIDVMDATTGAPAPGLGIADTTFNDDGHNQLDAGDVDGNGRDEVLIANDASGRIDVLDATTGAPAPGLGVPDTTFDDDGHNQMAVGRFGDGDFDADGLPDQIELAGIRNADGSMNLDLKNQHGASPCRRTIVVEYDFMADPAPGGHSHALLPDARRELQDAFAGAPLPAIQDCPYPGADATEGIQMILLEGNALPEQPVLAMPAGFATIKAANFDAVRDPFVHYAVLAHRYSLGGTTTDSSGLANFSTDSQDFLVSLGGFGGGVGTVREQSGTFMHELGHGLGLRHGGGDEVNHKPNYLSVMSYRFQTSGLEEANSRNTAIDYSRQQLPTLDSGNLVEADGLGPDAPQLKTSFYDLSGTPQHRSAVGAIDWTTGDFDGNGTADDDTAAVAVNGGRCVGDGGDGVLSTTAAKDDKPVGNAIHSGDNFVCETAAAASDAQEVRVGTNQRHLTGFDDWAHLNLRRGLRPGEGIAEREITVSEVEQLNREQDQAAAPDRKVRLATPPAGFRSPVLGVAMDQRNLYATVFTESTTAPFVSAAPGSLVVLDRATLAERARIPVGHKPRGVAVNETTGRIYVLNTGKVGAPNDSEVTVIDRATLAVVTTVTLHTGQALTDVLVNPRTNRVYLSNSSQGVIHVLDGATNAELAPVSIGKGAVGMTLDPASNTVHVAMNFRSAPPTVTALGSFTDDGVNRVIHPKVVLGEEGLQPIDVTVDPASNRIYTANLGGGGVHPSVSVIDGKTRTVLKTVDVSTPARAITVNPYARQVFVAGEGGVRVIGMDALSVVRTVAAGTPAGQPFSVTTAGGTNRQYYLGDLRTGELTRLSYSTGTTN